MSWVITGSEKVARDPYLYTNTVLLLKGDGTNGSTAILDSSKVAGSPKTVTAVGSAQISTAQNKFGGASIIFNGSTDYLTIANSSAFDFGTSDVTIEAWVRLSLITGQSRTIFGAWGANGAGYAIAVSGSGYLSIEASSAPSFGNYAQLVSTTTQLSVDTWYHIAYSRSGGTNYLFVGGQQQSFTGTLSVAWNTAGNPIAIGRSNAFNNAYLNGYIDDLRITKGIARYETGTGANVGKMVFAGTNTLALPTAPFPDI